MRLGDLDALIGYFGDLTGDTIAITDVQAVLDNASAVECAACEYDGVCLVQEHCVTACSAFRRHYDAEVHCPDCPEGGCTAVFGDRVADYADGCGGRP